jgi:hypothetical protein
LSPVTDDYNIVNVWAVGQRITEFRADAGRLAGCNYEWLAEIHTRMRG